MATEYFEEWGEPERKLWDAQGLITDRENYSSNEQYDQARLWFDVGWLKHDNMTQDDRVQARERYFDITALPPDQFNWEAWREYMGYT